MSRHLAVPIRLGADGSFATVAEDSDAEVVQNVAMLLRTRPGERLATPDLGVPDPTFVGFDAPTVLALVIEQEPRADLDVVEQVLSDTGLQVADVTVRRRES